MIAHILFWLCISLLIYSYILYPILVDVIFRLSANVPTPEDDNNRKVFILLAAHNEELVIEEKLNSINSSNYPIDKVFIYIGSDHSTDATNELVQLYMKKSKYPIYFKIMKERSGKIGTINKLHQYIQSEHKVSSDDIYILTDADVMFRYDTITKLSRHFKNPNIGVVDTQIHNIVNEHKNVSKSESIYLNQESKLKFKEGQIFGKLMGTFGGCFSLRSVCFKPIPGHFRVDDFFLTMHAMTLDYKAISDPEAICDGKILSTFPEEFKRKRRMGSGNFQNMMVYKKYLLPFSSLGFVFFSHKAIRYIGPLLMIVALVLSGILALKGSILMQFLLLGQMLWYFAIPLLDRISSFLGINILALRSISYFNYMNLALLLGFKDYIYGIESNIWEPTKRA